MDLIGVIVAPFILAVGALGAHRWLSTQQQGWLSSAALGASFAVLANRLLEAQQNGVIVLDQPWLPQLGLSLSLYVDGLALFFGLLITGIAVPVFFFAGYYLEEPAQAGSFFALLLAFTGSMLWLVLAGNLLALFIAWELTSVISFLLISFKGTDAEARRGAAQALVITGGGGLTLLIGLLLAGRAVGSMELAALLASGEALRQSPLYEASLLLIALGCFSKSAQFPLHFWLPDAMSAPTPASAFLHSATMVKAGIYLLARFYPVLGNTDLWMVLLSTAGSVTMLWGALLALRQRDLKGMLAFSTISQLGALTALIGQPDSIGLKAALVGLLAHALYKCCLFLVVGTVDHATGTRNIDELGGLQRRMPGLALVTVIAGASMAGVPPLFGFAAKEFLLASLITQPLVLAAVVTSAALTAALALRLYVEVFLGQSGIPLPQEEHADHDRHHPLGDDAYDYSHHHHVPRLMIAGPALLAVLSIAAGVGIAPLITPLIQPALAKSVELYLFPPEGFNLAFGLSLTALALGAVIFAARHSWLAWTPPSLPTGPQLYRGAVAGLESAADLLLRSQGGKIRYYLVAILLSVVLLLITIELNIEPVLASLQVVALTSVAGVLKGFLLLLALGATLASIMFRNHLLAALALAVAGYAIGGIFLLQPAPDVALVQFLVETLATVLIFTILARTSEEERSKAMDRLWSQSRSGLARDLVVSAGLGLAVMVFALAAVGSRPTPNPIAAWHLQNALPQVGANDVVAGIITDFRGTDTLIEIIVFGMAALGVLTLLARPNPGKPLRPAPPREPAIAQDEEALRADAERPEKLQYRSRIDDPITRLAALPLLPLAMLIALAHIAYAGVAPGDGFTAGVICGLGVTLWYVVFGYEAARQRLRWLHPSRLIGVGLLLALLNPILPLLAGRAFFAFTALTGFSLADIKLASSLIFEIGICLAVFGGVSAIIEAISHPKEVEPL